jgi:hypothetical protein
VSDPFPKLEALSAIRDDRELGKYAKLVFFVLLSHADAEGFCFPGLETLALECGIGRTAVVAAVRELEIHSWVARRRRTNSSTSGGRASNGYSLSTWLRSARDRKSVTVGPRPKEGWVTVGNGGGLRSPGDREERKRSTPDQNPLYPPQAGERKSRPGRVLIPDDLEPRADTLTVAQNGSVDVASVLARLRASAQAGGWRRVDWQAQLHAWVLGAVAPPSRVRNADPDAERREVNRLIEDAQAGQWGPDVARQARELRGHELTALAKSLEHRPKRRFKVVGS